MVSYETIRRWCHRFGPHYARDLRRRQPASGDHWFLDEVFVNIQGQRHYLWRAIDQDGDVLDILLQHRRNSLAAKRFLRKLLKRQQRSPNRLVTDKLASVRVAHREEMPVLCTIQPSTQTTVLKRLTDARGSENDRCWGFVRWETRNDFSVFNLPY